MSSWQEMFSRIREVVYIVILCYFFILCTFYFILFILSIRKAARERDLHHIETYKKLKNSSFTPPLSIIVPAYNEEAGVIATILSLVTGRGRLDYPQFEVIVVNDGSTDQTLQKVTERFQMEPIQNKVVPRRNGIDTAPINKVYRSKTYPHLLLIDKVNGGKADALNAGINLSKYPYFASIDGDTILNPDSFLKIMKPIIENADHEILAAGGSVLIANGSEVIKGQMQEARLPRNPLVIMQVIEYLRAFLTGRMGLSRRNLLLVISGAFGVFKTSRVIEVGGYNTSIVGEDMELVVRLHRANIEKGWGAKIEYVTDPVCYTEAPESFKYLRRQRVRWHRGLFESLWLHRRMMFHPKYGSIGFVAMPFYFFVEFLGPLVEFMGYFLLFIDVLFGLTLNPFTIVLFILMVIYGSFLSMGAVLIEDWRLGRYEKLSDLHYLLFYALTEAIWYRPLQTFWRMGATLSLLFGKTYSWGDMKRKGIST